MFMLHYSDSKGAAHLELFLNRDFRLNNFFIIQNKRYRMSLDRSGMAPGTINWFEFGNIG